MMAVESLSRRALSDWDYLSIWGLAPGRHNLLSE